MNEELKKIKDQLDRMESKQNGDYLRTERRVEDAEKKIEEHRKEDNETHAQVREQLRRLDPMIKLFEENKIVKARLSKDAKTIILYAGGLITLGGAWYIVKALIIKLFHP